MNDFTSSVCSECGCSFEYNREYVDKNDGYFKCPECLHLISGLKKAQESDDKDLDVTYLKLVTSYKHDFSKEEKAINDCVKTIDFEALAKACAMLSGQTDDYDYLADNTEKHLRERRLLKNFVVLLMKWKNTVTPLLIVIMQ